MSGWKPDTFSPVGGILHVQDVRQDAGPILKDCHSCDCRSLVFRNRDSGISAGMRPIVVTSVNAYRCPVTKHGLNSCRGLMKIAEASCLGCQAVAQINPAIPPVVSKGIPPTQSLERQLEFSFSH